LPCQSQLTGLTKWYNLCYYIRYSSLKIRFYGDFWIYLPEFRNNHKIFIIMKKLVFFAVILSILFTSCGSLKNLSKNTVPKTVLSVESIKKFDLTPKVITLGVQFFSDTLEEIRLEPIKNEEYLSDLKPDGTISLDSKSIEPIVFKPGTPGILTTRVHIIFEKGTKKIEFLKISFDKNNPRFYLPFGPSRDEEGTFVLLPNKDGNTITYGGIDYQFISGKFSSLYFASKLSDDKGSENVVEGIEIIPKK